MISVHAGAGYHSSALEAAYKRDLAAACRAGAAALAGGGDALAAVTAAIKVLEDSAHCNAGRGSNLSFNGGVECDASVMEGDGSFGAVAAAPGIQNPIEAAALLARESRQPLSNGRVRPMMLAGDAARVWAASHGLPAATSAQEAASWHQTEQAQRQWRKYRRIVDSTAAAAASGSASPPPGQQQHQAEEDAGVRKRARQGGGGSGSGRRDATPPAEQQAQAQQAQQQGAPADSDSACCFYDTVGCVALAPDGRVAAGVSSGGIALKTEGRVGEAGCFGAGCWAQGAAAAPAAQQGGEPALACSVTGVGEHVMRHLLARELCQAAAAAEGPAGSPGASQDSRGTEAGTASGEPPLAQVAAQLLQRTILRGPPPHDCGLLCLKAQPLGGGGPPGATNGEAPRPAGCGGHAAPQQTQQAPQRFAVEVAVAHSAQSMAVGHLSCSSAAGGSGGGAGSSGGGPAAAPAVLILRRQASCSGPAPDVQTYMHGTTVVL